MKKSALITGISGQDGAYLAALLVSKGYKVVGLSIDQSKKQNWRLEYLGVLKKIKFYHGSILDKKILKKLFQQYKFSEVYNLAGQSSVAKSWENPEETFSVNFFGVLNLVEAIKNYSPKSRFFNASSAEIYGESKGVINENTNEFKSSNPYGASKIAAHLLIQSYRTRYNLHLSNGILFTHTSPLQADFFVAKQIVSGVAKIAMGKSKKVVLGNLSVKRDWSFAGDVVQAIHLILKQTQPGDYVICSGQSWSVKELACEALRQIGITSQQQKYLSVDKNRQRRKDVKDMRGTAVKLNRLGWQAKTTVPQMIKIMLDFEFNQNNYGLVKE